MKNVRRVAFHRLFRELPRPIRTAAMKAFRVFLDKPSHPSLRLHALEERHDSAIAPGSFSVSITIRYRAVYFVDGDTNVWYWIGSHSDYNRLVGRG